MDAAYPEDVDVECQIDDCVAIREVNDLIQEIGDIWINGMKSSINTDPDSQLIVCFDGTMNLYSLDGAQLRGFLTWVVKKPIVAVCSLIGPAGSIDIDKDRKEMLRRDSELFCKMIMKEVSR